MNFIQLWIKFVLDGSQSKREKKKLNSPPPNSLSVSLDEENLKEKPYTNLGSSTSSNFCSSTITKLSWLSFHVGSIGNVKKGILIYGQPKISINSCPNL